MVLGLFFSRGVSLQLWLDKGLFDREKLLYEKHLENNTLKKVYWFTYGIEDKELSIKLKNENRLHSNINVLSMPKIFNIPKIGSYVYSFLLPFFQKKYLKECTLYKTNQTDGSWSAVIAKKLYNKKLIYRTGFTMSQLENKLKRFNFITLKTIELSERWAYKSCDKAVVASKHNLEYVSHKYNIDREIIELIYNFIDKEKFFDFHEKRDEKVIFVGRLSDEKNIFNLITALNRVGLPLEIYGSGKLKEEIQRFIQQNNYDVKLKGNISNNELPKILNQNKYYALVSKHEGMPKSLIEAMACGCICIGTNVAGINEVIIDNKNGFLSEEITSASIEKIFCKVKKLSRKELLFIRNNAQKNIDMYFTLMSIIEKERKIIKNLI